MYILPSRSLILSLDNYIYIFAHLNYVTLFIYIFLQKHNSGLDNNKNSFIMGYLKLHKAWFGQLTTYKTSFNGYNKRNVCHGHYKSAYIYVALREDTKQQSIRLSNTALCADGGLIVAVIHTAH